jgi:hypothetical protein
MNWRDCAWHGTYYFCRFPHFKLNHVISFPSKRAELKLQSPEQQARIAALNKEYQATYREKHKSPSLYVRAQRRRHMANHKHQAPGLESLEQAQYCISDGGVEGDKGNDDQNLADVDEV